jgi:hypothetical protein
VSASDKDKYEMSLLIGKNKNNSGPNSGPLASDQSGINQSGSSVGSSDQINGMMAAHRIAWFYTSYCGSSLWLLNSVE